MAKLPHDARVAFVTARSSFTPSSERLSRLHSRIQAAALSGTEPNVPSDVAAARRFVGLERAKPWLLRLDAKLLSVVSLSILIALGLLLLSRPRTADEEPPAVARRAAAELAPSRPSTTPSERVIPPTQPRAPAQEASPAPQTQAKGAAAAPPASAPAPQSDHGARTTSRRERTPKLHRRDSLGPLADVPQDREPRLETSDQPVRRLPATPPRTTPGTRVGDDRLSEEVRLLALARDALEAGQVAEAEAALREHRGTFPTGQLVSERIALEVQVRCVAQDAPGARRLLDELLLRAPDGVLKRMVERTCGAMLVR